MDDNRKRKLIHNKKLVTLSRFRGLILFVGLMVVLLGLINIGQLKTEYHEEEVSFTPYRFGLAQGTDVSFDAVAAEVLSYTSDTETNTIRSGTNKYQMDTITYYAYVLLTDADGTQAIAVWSMVKNGYLSDTSLAKRIESLVDTVNRQGGRFYGVISENEIAKQEVNLISIDPLDEAAMQIAINEAFNGKNRAVKFPAISVYEEMPGPRTIIDSSEFVLEPFGVVCLCAGFLVIFLSLLLFWAYSLQDQDETPVITIEQLSALVTERNAQYAASQRNNTSTPKKTSNSSISLDTAMAGAAARAKNNAKLSQAAASGKGSVMADDDAQGENTAKPFMSAWAIRAFPHVDVTAARLEQEKRQVRQAQTWLDKFHAEARMQAEAQAKKRAEKQAAFTKRLEARVAKIPPTGRAIVSQKGQQQLFHYAAAALPELAAFTEPPHRSARLFTEEITDPETLLDTVSAILEDTSRVIEQADLETRNNSLWSKLDDEALEKAYKAFGFYAELAVGSENFTFMQQLFAELLLERKK